MQEEMGINKLAQMFMGNPQPLQAKVEQSQKQAKPGEIPPDLKEALALQQILKSRNAMQNQQAMQAGGPQPTIVDKLRQMLGQNQPQGGMPPTMAQAGPPQGGMPPQGMPPQGMPPQGMPPVQAAHGGHIAQLMSNLGQHYGNGGIVAFNGKDERVGSEVPDRELSKEEAEAIMRRMQQRTGQIPRDAIDIPPVDTNIPGLVAGNSYAKAMREARGPEPKEPSPEAAKDSEGIKKALGFVGNLPLEALKTLVSAPGYGFSKNTPTNAPAAPAAPVVKQTGSPDIPSSTAAPAPQAAAQQKQKQQASAQPAAPRPPAEPQVTGTPYNPADATRRADFPSDVESYLRNKFATDKEAEGNAAEDKYNRIIGAVDTSGHDRALEELKKRQQQFAAPATGMPALMEYLQQIATAPKGLGSLSAGAYGAQKVNELKQQREANQFDLAKQILEQEQKKIDAKRGYAKELYGVNAAAVAAAGKEAHDAAIALNKSEDEARKLQKEAEIRTAEMLSREKTNAATNAAHITAANAGAASRSEEAKARRLQQQEQFLAKMDETRKATLNKDPIYQPLAQQKAALEMARISIKDESKAAELDAKIEALNGKMIERAIAVSGGAAPKGEARPGAPLPMPATEAELVKGKIYNTARGPAKWNGSGFTPI